MTSFLPEVRMMKKRPVSDLKDKLSETESDVRNGMPVCLTRNGRGTAVLLSLAQYERLTNPLEAAFDEAYRMAEETYLRLTHEEVFTKIRERK